MSEVDPDQARDTADEILRRPEFRAQEPSLLDRAVDWLLDRVADVLTVVFGGGGTIAGWLVLGLALAALVYLVWRFAPRRRPTADRSAVAVRHTVEGGRSRSEWLAEAEAAEAEGAWGRAVHARWHALVAGLADRSRLADDPAVTSGEHREAFAQAVAAEPVLSSRFGGATGRYEDVWFGGRPADRGDRDALVDDDRAVLDGLERLDRLDRSDSGQRDGR